jgi:hypothetical protein
MRSARGMRSPCRGAVVASLVGAGVSDPAVGVSHDRTLSGR